ncbi:glutathione S-transferase family protein [Aromatoleum aromaticum]|uniref:Glutathione S-transferase family protein n=1 Tax=Aromatoleum aromaticum (strain DSM 19018 / LMG 30748 / EbN1) TaxID=76114 RepID=Q5P1P9_AROAE|nr:glutathione S-transferase family protein [Aromatoleum aromaticum]NMG54601.1 glutathione S-transferase [Aromatoleum aromaticum]CAI08765.1 Glutathione S-transferase family protein [Aromatoleum aromaticum EbN1]
MTMTLYHCLSARSFRPLWMLEELGLPYELKVLPFPPRREAEPYLAVNPLGTIPAFFDGDTRLTESVAICQYLAARHSPRQLDVGSDEPAFGAYLNFLHFGEATLTFPQTLILRYSRFEPPERRLPQAAEDYTRWFLSRLRTLEPLLEHQEYLCAARFTAADVSVGYALLLADDIGLRDRFKPATRAYWQRLQARDGFRRALAAQQRAAVEQGVAPQSVARASGPF